MGDGKDNNRLDYSCIFAYGVSRSPMVYSNDERLFPGDVVEKHGQSNTNNNEAYAGAEH